MDFDLIPTELIVPNTYNPNKLSKDEFNELKIEVKRLGKPPKPIIVRPHDGRYEIVDGEHGWRVAKELGLSEVPCEVVDIDEFEARRQTFKRNCHGRNDPLKLGQMFEQMRLSRKLSIRKLAKEIDVPEATVRNYLAYVKAFEVRNRCAREVDELIKVHFGNFITDEREPVEEAVAKRSG